MAGKRQHYVPRFLQRGFLAESVGKGELTWLHRQGVASRLVSIRDVGVEEFFYSKLGDEGEATLDDLITSVEAAFDSDVREIKRTPVGALIDPAVPARLATHLFLRTAHLRSFFQRGIAQLLEELSTCASDPSQLRDLVAIDTEAGMERVLSIVDEEARGQPFEKMVAHPFARRFIAFLARESFDEIFAAQMPQMLAALSRVLSALPTMMRDAHNNALRKADQTQWEIDLAQLSWRTQRVVGAILPDCIALTQSGTDSFTPLSLKEHDAPNTIILPIAHDLLLVGSQGEPVELV